MLGLLGPDAARVRPSGEPGDDYHVVFWRHGKPLSIGQQWSAEKYFSRGVDMHAVLHSFGKSDYELLCDIPIRETASALDDALGKASPQPFD